MNFYECKYFENVYRISMIDKANIIFYLIDKAKKRNVYFI